MLTISTASRVRTAIFAGLLATLGWFLMFGLFGAGLFAYALHMDSERPFEHRFLLRPYSCGFRHVELHASGIYEAGGDQVVANSQITITLTTNDGGAHAKTLRYTDDGMFQGDETYVRVSGKPEALAEWIRPLLTDPDKEALSAETVELSQAITSACAGCTPGWYFENFFHVRR